MEHEVGPGVEDGVGGGESEAVRPGGEDVHFDGYAGFVTRFEKHDGVFDGNGFVRGRVGQENRRGVFCHASFGRELLREFFIIADESLARTHVRMRGYP